MLRMTAAMRGTDPTDPPECRLAEWSTKLGCFLETNLQRVVTASGWIASGDLFGCCLTEWSTIGSVVAQGAPLKRLQSQEQSTASWLTPICDLTQWDASFCFSSFFSILQRKRNKMLCGVLWRPAVGWRTSNALIPNVDDMAINAEVQATFVMEKNLRMRISKIRTKRERER